MVGSHRNDAPPDAAAALPMMMPHASRGDSARACARIASAIFRGSETLAGRPARLNCALPPEDVALERVLHLVQVSVTKSSREVLPSRIAGDKDDVAVWRCVARNAERNGECCAS